jgi:hypothetical protein
MRVARTVSQAATGCKLVERVDRRDVARCRRERTPSDRARAVEKRLDHDLSAATEAAVRHEDERISR